MVILIRLLKVLFICMAVSGCSNFKSSDYIQNRDKHYLAATNIPPLLFPPGISSYAIQSYYPIANHSYPEEAKRVDLKPPGM